MTFAKPIVKANLEILPDHPFDLVARKVAELFNIRSLDHTKRFDEVPAMVGVFDRHEIILFDVPSGESHDENAPWSYALEVFPVGQFLDGEVEDISENVCQRLESKGLKCHPFR